MLVREIEWFRDHVAIPKMRELLANTAIPEGMCCIDKLEISFFDGRSFGVDSEIKASGFVYKDGKVDLYSYEERDVSIAEFAVKHNNCVFISDGKLSVWNELEETEINSLIRNKDFCARLFSELTQADSLRVETNLIEYTKMKYLYQAQTEKKKAFEEQVQMAEGIASGTHPATDKGIFNKEPSR